MKKKRSGGRIGSKDEDEVIKIILNYPNYNKIQNFVELSFPACFTTASSSGVKLHIYRNLNVQDSEESDSRVINTGSQTTPVNAFTLV